MYKISFFIKQREEDFFSLLKPLRFSIHDKKAIWQYGENQFIIQPFSTVGREAQGYRVYFNGDPDAFQYLFHSTIGPFNPIISGLEYVWQTYKTTQRELVNMAEQCAGLRRMSLYGLYDYNGIGVVILPNGQVVFQIRNKKVRQNQIAKKLREIEFVVNKLKNQEYDLFSIEKESV